jgi:hypothetical protein
VREKPIMLAQITDILIEESRARSMRSEINNSLLVQGDAFERIRQ